MENLFHSIAEHHHDDYTPKPTTPTNVAPGKDKLAVFAERLARGEELWHPDDKQDMAGCVNVRPSATKVSSLEVYK